MFFLLLIICIMAAAVWLSQDDAGALHREASGSVSPEPINPTCKLTYTEPRSTGACRASSVLEAWLSV